MEKGSEINDFLCSALEQFPFSERFIRKTKKIGLSSLKEIVALGWVKLQKLEGFDYGCLNELVRFLEQRDQLNLLTGKKK
ncbi:hypothetical protein MTO98_25875 [Mucilaginibacter sp. SMC90]|uniref:hypothetical protein n=1 Tax=Mucilaginibacter sp. SMC90 TaxID=2929803 RepID=UPI001FB476B9|nr:hypothetical protein [Mucilaginibacter sp. SMC90]UOE47843.1 hypothetical protein MTO98_25875 [Mucilaginibacter sp. SMC90]